MTKTVFQHIGYIIASYILPYKFIDIDTDNILGIHKIPRKDYGNGGYSPESEEYRDVYNRINPIKLFRYMRGYTWYDKWGWKNKMPNKTYIMNKAGFMEGRYAINKIREMSDFYFIPNPSKINLIYTNACRDVSLIDKYGNSIKGTFMKDTLALVGTCYTNYYICIKNKCEYIKRIILNEIDLTGDYSQVKMFKLLDKNIHKLY